MNRLPALVFNRPLMIDSEKAAEIAAVLEHKMRTGSAPAAFDQDGDGSARRPPYQIVDGIAVISVTGTLVSRSYGLDAMSGFTDYAEIERRIARAEADGSVAGILLDIDSPGGDVAGSFELAEFVTSQIQKPIYAAANFMAYSAAYMLASATDRIFVSPTGGVGSVGVIAMYLDQSRADQANGLDYTFVRAPAGKARLTGHEPLTEDAAADIRSRVDRVATDFFSLVEHNRGIPAATVRGHDAEAFHAERAVALGYADQIGTIRDALAALSAAVASGEIERGRTAQSQAVSRGDPTMTDKQKAAENPGAKHQGAAPSAPTEPDYAAAASVMEQCQAAGLPSLAGRLLRDGVLGDKAAAAIADAKGVVGVVKAFGCPKEAADVLVRHGLNESAAREVLAATVGEAQASATVEIVTAHRSDGQKAQDSAASAIDYGAIWGSYNGAGRKAARAS